MRNETYLKSVLFCAAAVLFGSAYAFAGTWTTLDKPGATETIASSIDGTNIVGWYSQDGASHGFKYDGSTWTPLDAPGAISTTPRGISGNRIIGVCVDKSSIYRGFIFDGSSWEILQAPGAVSTRALGIDGSKTAGYYEDSHGRGYGFIYEDQTWTTIMAPGAYDTQVYGIFGNQIFGTANCYGQLYNFAYDYAGGTWIIGIPVCPYDGDGTKIVGYNYWSDNRVGGAIWDISTRSTSTVLRMPGAENTMAFGIYGDNVVGIYSDTTWHGFVYEIPEPATLLLLGLGAAILRRKR
jgi:hypothetical protein